MHTLIASCKVELDAYEWEEIAKVIIETATTMVALLFL